MIRIQLQLISALSRCQGDTGAPLLSGDNTLVGTITGAAGCSSNSNYGIFNNMPSE